MSSRALSLSLFSLSLALCAFADLVCVAASVECYNGLVDLEQEYATFGRNMIHGTEDWVKVNREICKELAGALETHDRGMLSKKMPATLVDFKL